MVRRRSDHARRVIHRTRYRKVGHPGNSTLARFESFVKQVVNAVKVNPVTAGNPHVPVNSPAIGDLMKLFDFSN